jgi:ATP-dependent Clp protease adaptor protein ClpS
MPSRKKKPQDEPSKAGGGGGGTATKAKPKEETKEKVKELPPYHVVLLNDDDHSYEYVIEMLKSIFGHPAEMGYKLAQQVDDRGRAVVLTTHKEKAELKRDQIHSYGVDYRVATCQGSMSAIVQPADGAGA